jgi:hypothetical protein
MKFIIHFTEEAKEKLKELKNKPHLMKRYKAVVKALGFLQADPRHPGLKTHEFSSFNGPGGEKIFEAYAENNTPGAYRVFFFYGPARGEITVFTILPHP